MKNLIVLALFVSCIASVSAQNLTVALNIPSELSLAAVDLWNLSIVNGDNQTYTAYLVGTISEKKDGLIYNVQTAEFKLEPGLVQFNTNQYEILGPVNELFRASGYEQYLIRTNSLPNGEYEFCVTLHVVGSQNTFTSCTEKETKVISPPFLVSPADEDTVREQFPFFMWTPPAPVATQGLINYTIEIHEVLGFQKFQSSPGLNNAWYREKGISGTLHQYGLSSREFRKGKRYTWFVTAYYKNKFLAKSEIWQFVYYPSDNILGGGKTKTPPKKKESSTKSDVFYSLNKSDLGEYMPVNEESLKFIYSNTSSLKEVDYRIVDEKMLVVDQGKIELKYGINYIKKEIASLGMSPNALYLLEVVSKRKTESMRFIYQPSAPTK